MIQYLENPDLRYERFQHSIQAHQDNGSEQISPFPMDIISTIEFFKIIKYSVLNLSEENGERDKFENDLFHSFEFLDKLLNESAKEVLCFEISDFIFLIADIFVNIDIDNNDPPLFQFYNAIFRIVLNCMCNLISCKSNIFQSNYNCYFIDRLLQVLDLDLNSGFEKTNNLIVASQFLFLKLIEDKEFLSAGYFLDWKDVSEKYFNNEDILASIYYELSKHPSIISLDRINDFLYSILCIFPNKDNLSSKIILVKKNTQSIVNCIEKIDKKNANILEQAKIDINNFMPKIINIIEISKPILQIKKEVETIPNFGDPEIKIKNLIEVQNIQVLCFCRLIRCFIKKGIIMIEDNFFIVQYISNLFESIIKEEEEFNYFNTDYSIEAFEQILHLFSFLVDLQIPLYEFISIPNCLKLILESPFKVRNQSALLVNKMIEINECSNYIDDVFYHRLLNLIILSDFEIIAPLLNCLYILLTNNDKNHFISFIYDPQKFDELENLKDALNEISENVNNDDVSENAENILDIIIKESPRDRKHRYGNSYYSDNNVYDV